MFDAHFYGFYTVNKTILSCNKTILSCNKTILPVIKPLQPVRKPFHNSKLLLKHNKRTMLHEEDVDLEASLASGADLMPKTEQLYGVWLRRYAEFHRTDPYQSNRMIAMEFFTDECIAKFIIASQQMYGTKPHTLKAMMAAISHGVTVNALPNIHEFSHLYPMTHRAVKVFKK